MSERQRLRREDPARSEPIRNWSNLYRGSDSWSAGESRANRNPADGAARNGADNDAVEHGVRTGYEVIEKHIREIRQGQGIAGQINRGPYDSRGIGDDILDIVERIYRYSRNLLPSWLDLAGSIVNAPELLRDLPHLGKRKLEARSNGTPADSPIAIEMLTNRPTRITLDLRPQSDRLSLGVHGLYAIDAAKPPLTDINFVPASANDGAALRIRVPEGQPPATYSGVVIDLDSEEPRGTLSVRIYE